MTVVLHSAFFLVCVASVTEAQQTSISQSDGGFCSHIFHTCGIGPTGGIRGRTGKSGPIGPPGNPGKPAVVDYDVINEKIADKFQTLSASVETRLSNLSSVQEAVEQNRVEIRQLRSDLQALQAKYDSLQSVTSWHKGYNGRFYKLFKYSVSYQSAKARCRQNGAILASAGIRDSHTRSELLHFAGHSIFWIGLTDSQTEGHFAWDDGVRSSGSDVGWHSDEPNNYGGNEDCAVYYHYKNGWWANDDSCSKTYYFLCEKSI